MHESPELAIAALVCFTLVVGAALRGLARRWGFPYTVALLCVGLGLGLALPALEHGPAGHVVGLLAHGRELGPDLIIFIFLPALVFESAFAIPVHAFRKVVAAAVLLAVPMLLVAIAATAALMVGLTGGHWAWGWGPALVFGALISATDPVAVVALLRELGAPKRLGLLIESESLLNDGTAIVAFTVLVGLLTGGGGRALGPALGRVALVTGGGLGVGLVLALGCSWWLRRLANQPLVEITLTLALAYLCMVVAEGLCHVSGVMAIVAAGLWMSGPGRVHISPEVTHFLHRFWEMLSYLANTLIFFLVGLVIATHLGTATWGDAGVVAAAFAALVVLRFALCFGFRPILNRVTDPITPAETTVMAWGGLRGAVSLALALVVYRHTEVDPDVGRQILLATAAVVFGTIVVNGTTMAGLLRRLGFDRAPPGERLARLAAEQAVLSGVRARLADASDSRGLRTVDWGAVRQDLQERTAQLAADTKAARAELAAAPAGERLRGWWRQVLGVEREAYWTAFAEGTLSGEATRQLDHEVDLELDRLARGEDVGRARRALRGTRARVTSMLTPDATADRPPRWWERLRAWWHRGGHAFGQLRFESAERRYELCRGEAAAATRVLAALDQLPEMDGDAAVAIRAAYRRMLHASLGQLEDLRANLPEVTRAIETRLARRVQLEFERDGYQQLARGGTLDADAAEEAAASVAERLARLRSEPRRLALPSVHELCRDLPLLAALPAASRDRLAGQVRERTVNPGEVIARQGDAGDCLFLVARGTVAVVEEQAGETVLLDLVGRGGVLGEMALLTGEPRSATLRAVGTGTLGELPRAAFEELMATSPEARREVWRTLAAHRFDNCVRAVPALRHLSHDARVAWFARGTVTELAPDAPLPDPGEQSVFVAAGGLSGDDHAHPAPALLAAGVGSGLRAQGRTVVVCLPADPFGSP